MPVPSGLAPVLRAFCSRFDARGAPTRGYATSSLPFRPALHGGALAEGTLAEGTLAGGADRQVSLKATAALLKLARSNVSSQKG